MIFRVHGVSVSQGSLTAVPTNRNWRTVPGVRWVVKDAKPALKPWRDKVAAHAAAEFGSEPWSDVPIAVTVKFVFERPRSHYFVRRDGDVLRPDAPTLVTSHQAGDLDKHVRAILDALTGVIFKDDSQVAELRAVKTYGTEPHCLISVHPVDQTYL